MPSAGAQLNLGLMDYELGDKHAALAEFRKAIQMDGNVRKQFEAATGAPQGGRGQRMAAVLADKAFVAEVLK
jgi:hypothetical protein